MRGLLWLLIPLAGCGRIGFDATGDASDGDDTVLVDTSIDVVAPTSTRVQHGNLMLSGTEDNVVVTPVDPRHTFLMFGYSGSFSDPDSGLVAGRISDSGRIAFRRQVAGVDLRIAWHLIETPHVSVQRGTYLRTTGEVSAMIPIDPVDLGRSIVHASAAGSGMDFGGNDHVRARFASTAMVQLDVGSSELPT